MEIAPIGKIWPEEGKVAGRMAQQAQCSDQ
jgi:hypothetical protein